MISIVGAGPVGALWSILLRQKGYAVQVFEKRGDPRLAAASAGRSINLVVTSRGLFGLELAGLTKLIENISVPVFGRMIHSKSGDLTYQAYGQKNECNYSVSRSELNNCLITEAEKIGVEFYFEHSLEAIDTSEKKLFFSNFTCHYEILFGADGSGSQLRKKLIEKFPHVEDKTQWLEADYKELSLPLDIKQKPQLQKDALHIWPRGAHMMMALANRDGSFTMTIYLPKNNIETKSTWGFNKIVNASDIEIFFKSEFSDAIPLMPDYISEFKNNPQGRLGTVRCSQWVFDESIALLGDAAHAIVPFFGQGMNCGFEDCTTLLKLIDTHEGNWSKILTAFEQQQQPNANAIADMALENWVEMKEKVGNAQFLLRKKIEATLELKYPGIFKSRYGLITYTLTPYSLAQKAGLKQNEIIDQLINGANSIESISWQKAEELIQTEWLEFVKTNNLDIKVYPKRN